MKKGLMMLLTALALGWMAPAEDASAAQRSGKRATAAKAGASKHRAPARKKAVGKPVQKKIAKKVAKKAKRGAGAGSAGKRSAAAM